MKGQLSTPDDAGTNAAANWRPAADFDALRARARMLAEVRAFFAERGVLEVDTPALARAGATDPHIASLETHCIRHGVAQRVYLQTSPEFAMKRLLAAGSGSIFQVCKAFRNDEEGPQHQTEFTMLEWYRIGFDHHMLMDEVDALLCRLLCAPAAKRQRFGDAFECHAGLNPFTATAGALLARAMQSGLSQVAAGDLDRNGLLDFLLTHVVLPALGRGSHCLFDFPASQAALARLRRGAPPVAERFEFYRDQVELANGYAELTDADELAERMRGDLRRRQEMGLARMPMDEALLAAMRHGLPECAGVALGLDRTLMLATGATRLEQVIAFPNRRA